MVSEKKVLVVNQHEVRRLLPMQECVDAVATALQSYSAGDAVQPLRRITWMPDKRGALGVMPAYLGQPELFGMKVVSFFPGNEGTPYETHQGAVLLFELEHGTLQAVIDAGAITSIRTAAASGAATRALARTDCRTLAILGTGSLGFPHLEAMCAVRELARVRIWSREPESAAAFGKRAASSFDLDVQLAASIEEAVRDADLVCTLTSAREPIVESAWLSDGTHVNAVGACMKDVRELDTATVVRSRFVVDSLESARSEAGDFLIAKSEGAVRDDHIVGELGRVLAGDIVGRTCDRDLTVFESLGLGIEDLAAAHVIYRNARARGAGVELEFGGLRDSPRS